METPQHIQKILDKATARDIADYIIRRNKKHDDNDLVTLNLLCKRFRRSQAEILRIIDSVDFLNLSDMAFLPAKHDDAGSILFAAFYPQFVDSKTPIGKRIVDVVEK